MLWRPFFARVNVNHRKGLFSHSGYGVCCCHVRIAPVSQHDDDSIEGVHYWSFKNYAWDMY